MNAIIMRLNALKSAQKTGLGIGLVALLITMFALARMVTAPSMTLLYSGLEAPQAGDVVRALEQRGEAYEIKGGTIFVPYQRRDELRMTLASEGLPANSSAGYELLDSLSGFGTTSQMFDAAYLRAKEGELARTIVSSSQISNARVHIAQSKSSAFNQNKTGTASIFVTPSGAALDSSQAKALRFLIASAVAGISPENVTVVDERSGLMNEDGEDTFETSSGSHSDNLKAKVLRLLEARVGPENAIVEVSVETVLQREQITERVFDPSSRVIISTDNEERNDTAEGSGTAGVTVASNLPDSNGAGTDSSKSNASETRERINYEVSETQREITKAPGAIKRLSVAVLVNGIEDPQTPGAMLPRSDEELAQLSALVQSAVGFNEPRGDTITVQSMTFIPQVSQGTGPSAPPLFNMALDLMTLIQMAILAVVALAIALLVIRPILRASPAPDLPALAPPISDELAAQTSHLNSDNGNFTDPTTGAVTVYDQSIDDKSAVLSGTTLDGSDETPVQRLREMIEMRQDETIDILRQWLEHKEQQGS